MNLNNHLSKRSFQRLLLPVFLLLALPAIATSCGEDKAAKERQEAFTKALREAGDPTWMMIDGMSKLAANLAADDFDCSLDTSNREVKASVTVTNDTPKTIDDEEVKKRTFRFTIGVESSDGKFRYGSAVLSIKNVQPGETKSGSVEFVADEIPQGSVCRMQGVD